MNALRRFPFQLPPDFLTRLGYTTQRTPPEFAKLAREQYGVELQPFTPRRYVALWWEPAGDELAFDDGTTSGAGQLNHWEYLAVLHRPGIGLWQDQNRIDLGSSEEPETHRLIVDSETGTAYVAPRDLAREIVRQQTLGVSASRLQDTEGDG